MEDHEEENEENIQPLDVEQGQEGSSNDSDTKKVTRKFSFADFYKVPRPKPKEFSIMQTFVLAYQSLGVVYGDLGTSALYVFPSITVSNPGEKDILGIVSLIFWTLTLMGLVKYILIVLHADDHGEGGTFALYSSLCQQVNFKSEMTIQNMRLDSDANLKFFNKGSSLQTKAKKWLEESSKAQAIFTFVVLLGSSMLIGDGVLTPAISVISAVQGIQLRYSKITQDDVVLIAVVILVLLFLFQRFGTSKVSALFSPIMLTWLVSIASIGLYNIITYYPTIFKAMSPHYIYYFFAQNPKKGWEILGLVTLCITGVEAMFADMGHFSKKAIQIAFSALVYPALLLAYGGEAAYLINHPEHLSTAFYSSIPSPVFWPMFVIATLAAIVASQSLISATYSIIRQSMALDYFPRVNIIHTSNKYEGRVYCPEINYFLMILCILIVLVFKGGPEIGNAYGVAVIWVMLITTCLMSVVMVVIWDTNIVLVIIYSTVFLTVEGVYMTSLLNKFPQGGWVPVIISIFFLSITLSWTYGRSKKNDYEATRKISREDMSKLVSSNEISRPAGICFFYTDLVRGFPPIIQHYVQHVGSLREVMVIVTVRTLPVKSVLPEERFLVGRLGPRGVYRCLVHYGYMDVLNMDGEDYIASIVEKLKEHAETAEELKELESATRKGVVFITGLIILKSSKHSSWLSCMVIDYLYMFLQKNFRSAISTLRIPPGKLLQVGMLYEI